MNAREAGFLLLTSHLGCPERNPLTVAQFRQLTLRVRGMARPMQDRELTQADLAALGYGGQEAARICALLRDRELLEYYVEQGARRGCVPITRVSESYPQRLRRGLGLDSPGCLWAKGDCTLLERPAVALVGSRELRPENGSFARAVGLAAAQQGYALVSGNARGADRAAQEAALAAGGTVIAVVADALTSQIPAERVLYLSEDGYGEKLSAPRALSRNRVIHVLGGVTFVAQAEMGTGGSWDGSARNLRFGWSRLLCFDDGSNACDALVRMGATPVGIDDLSDLASLHESPLNFLGQ